MMVLTRVLAIASCLLLAWALPVLADEGDHPGPHRVVVYSSDSDYRPYQFLDSEGQPAGLHVDLIREIGQLMGWKVDVRLDTWEVVRKSLEVSGEVDITDMARTPAREALFDFSDVLVVEYHDIYVRLAPHRRTLEEPAWQVSHCPDRVPWRRASVANEDGGAIVHVASEVEGLKLLASGAHDAAIVGQSSARDALRRLELSALVTAGNPVLPALYSFAVAKGHPELLAELNAGIRALRGAGRYEALRDKWLKPAKNLTPGRSRCAAMGC